MQYKWLRFNVKELFLQTVKYIVTSLREYRRKIAKNSWSRSQWAESIIIYSGSASIAIDTAGQFFINVMILAFKPYPAFYIYIIIFT